jgi:hypothetical protein
MMEMTLITVFATLVNILSWGSGTIMVLTNLGDHKWGEAFRCFLTTVIDVLLVVVIRFIIGGGDSIIMGTSTAAIGAAISILFILDRCHKISLIGILKKISGY